MPAMVLPVLLQRPVSRSVRSFELQQKEHAEKRATTKKPPSQEVFQEMNTKPALKGSRRAHTGCGVELADQQQQNARRLNKCFWKVWPSCWRSVVELNLSKSGIFNCLRPARRPCCKVAPRESALFLHHLQGWCPSHVFFLWGAPMSQHFIRCPGAQALPFAV